MTIKANKAIVTRLMADAWGQNRVAELDDYVSIENRHHLGAGTTIAFGPDQMRTMIANFRGAMPDFGCKIELVIAEDDLVVLHARFTGTQTASFAFAGRNLAPSNRTMDVPETFIARIADGKIVESWATWDRLTMLEQLGGL